MASARRPTSIGRAVQRSFFSPKRHEGHHQTSWSAHAAAPSMLGKKWIVHRRPSWILMQTAREIVTNGRYFLKTGWAYGDKAHHITANPDNGWSAAAHYKNWTALQMRCRTDNPLRLPSCVWQATKCLKVIKVISSECSKPFKQLQDVTRLAHPLGARQKVPPIKGRSEIAATFMVE